MRRWITALVLAFSMACQPPRVMPASPELSVSPSALVFGRVAVGASIALPLELSNGGRAASSPVLLSVEGPFQLSTSELTVAAGTTERVTVTFVPIATGAVTGTLRLSEGLPNVQLSGEAIAACESLEPCSAPRFDLTTRECVTDPRPEGAACTAPCIAGEGTCRGGFCTAAALSSCVDGDACTLDACTSAGDCRNPPIECPVTDPCQATYCDPLLGCGTTPVTDGVPCGEATCETAFICLGGRCQERARPNALSDCRYTAIAAGADHTCVVTVGQNVRCWGSNDEDQQARGFRSLLAVPGFAEGIGSARSVAAPLGDSTWVALTTGEVVQLNDGGRLPLNVARLAAGMNGEVCGIEQGTVRCANTSPGDAGLLESIAADAIDVSMSRDQLCVAFVDGGVSCGSRQSLSPVPLPGPATGVSAAARGTGCALVGEGVVCWGQLFDGGVGFIWDAGVNGLATMRFPNGPSRNEGACVTRPGGIQCIHGGSPLPGLDVAPHPPLGPARGIALGSLHGCVLLQDGRVACWGHNQRGQLGNRSSQPLGVHQLVSRASWLGQFSGAFGEIGGALLFAVDAGVVETLASLRSHTDQDAGSQWMIPRAVAVSDGKEEDYDRGCPCGFDGGFACGVAWPGAPAACASVRQGLCIAAADGRVRCFDGPREFDAWDAGIPVRAMAGEPRGDGACVVGIDGQLSCFNLSPANTAAQSLTRVDQLCFGRADRPSGGCAVLDGGTLQCWGPWVESAAPTTPLGAWPLVRKLTCGAEHFCTLSGNSIVQCWGDNQRGQLGLDGPASARGIGVPMPERVSTIAAGTDHTCVLLASARVLCWGSNYWGDLGQPILVQNRRPTLVTQ